MHPSSATFLQWDEGNEDELHDHRISPREVEQVFMGGAKWAPNKKGMSGDWKMIGYTSGGRALTIIMSWEEDDQILRAITGWDTTMGERTKYSK